MSVVDPPRPHPRPDATETVGMIGSIGADRPVASLTPHQWPRKTGRSVSWWSTTMSYFGPAPDASWTTPPGSPWSVRPMTARPPWWSSLTQNPMWCWWTSGFPRSAESTWPVRSSRTTPTTTVLILSAYDDEHYVRAALAAGVAGYLLKTTPSDELVRSIRAACDGSASVGPGPVGAWREGIGHSRTGRRSQADGARAGSGATGGSGSLQQVHRPPTRDQPPHRRGSPQPRLRKGRINVADRARPLRAGQRAVRTRSGPRARRTPVTRLEAPEAGWVEVSAAPAAPAKVPSLSSEHHEVTPTGSRVAIPVDAGRSPGAR